VPIAAELVHDEIAQGRSVVLFANFRKTIDTLSELLQNYHPSIVVGGQKPAEREREVGIFQSNQSHLLLVQIDSGCEAMDAHDLEGRPRTSVTLPGLSVNRMRQAFGRINRAGALSPAIQRVVLLQGLDQRLFEKLSQKTFNMDTLTVSDLVDVERLGIKVTKDYELRNQDQVAAFTG